MPTVKDDDKSGALRAAARVIGKTAKAKNEAKRLKIPGPVFSKMLKALKKTATAALKKRHMG